MEKSTKIIISIMLLILIIIIIIVALLLINRNTVNLQEDNPETIAFQDTEKVDNKTLFFNINHNINNYFTYVQENNANAIESISSNNVIELKHQYTSQINFISQDMYVIDKISNITVYVYGVIRENNIQDDYYLIINMDYNNNAFSVTPISKEEYDSAVNNQVNERYKQDINIQKNLYNEIKEINVTDFEVLKLYFEDYKFNAINNTEHAFEILDSEYRQKKFNNNIEEYKQYIQNNLNRLLDANIVQHGITKNGQYGEYIAIDNYNNYYKIKETGINSYTIILDNYTLENDELINEYNKLSDKEKVASIVDKVMKLINTKSYTELYGYLNNDFKNNYFKTQESFEKYINENFFANNIVGSLSLKNEGTYYTVTVPYKESLSSAAEQRSKTFIIRLKTGTDFELSFNI